MSAKQFYNPNEIVIRCKYNVIYDESLLRSGLQYLNFIFNRRIIRISLTTEGYPIIINDKKAFRVHRIIGRFIYNDKEGIFDYHHIDKNKLNASADNLLQVTNSEHQRIHATGRHLSETHKEAVSRAHKGKPAHNRMPILMLDKEGNVICEFASVVEAAHSLGIWRTSISNNLRGRSKFCNNHKFVYKYE